MLRVIEATEPQVYMGLMPPACNKEQRRDVEAKVVKGLMSLTGDLKGDYYPLAGSTSYPPKPTGMKSLAIQEKRALAAAASPAAPASPPRWTPTPTHARPPCRSPCLRSPPRWW